LQNLILLNLLETAVHGYSTRDGADFAIKLTILATELHQLVWSYPENCFVFSVSVAEAQLRRLAPRRSEGNYSNLVGSDLCTFRFKMAFLNEAISSCAGVGVSLKLGVNSG